MSTVTCPSCGRETAIDSTWKFCRKCGSHLPSKLFDADPSSMRPASTPTSAAQRQSISAEVSSAAMSPSTRPSKAYIFVISLAFCFVGAAGGGVIGFLAHLKGAGFATAGIAAGGAAGENLQVEAGMNLHRFADLTAWLINNDRKWVVLVLAIVAAVGVAYLTWS